MSEAIGIMNEAYFVGRHELIDWVNNLLKVNITKVEECCTGAIHCQIFDVLYPGKMNMTKVNFEAKHEYEFVKNFKLLQDMFDKVDIQHHVPVEKIIKGKYQDNLELLQWVYEVFNRTYNGGDYDPIKRRSKSKGGLSAFKGSRGGAAGMARALPGKENKVKSTTTATKKPAGEAVRQTTASAAATTKHAGQDDALAKAKKDIEEMHGVLKELEKERDWYFSKILDVEKICKEAEESPMIQQILEVLYATDNDIGADDHPISIDTTMGEQTV